MQKLKTVKTISDVKKLAEKSLEDGKAFDIVTINLKGKTDIADYMIVATGNSSRHTSALAKNLIDKIKEGGVENITVEGANEGEWVLVDIGGVVVHIFKTGVREHYNLEKMWDVPVNKKIVELVS